MIHVCFVCLGNICRSPLAQGALEFLAKEHSLKIYVDSAGTVYPCCHIGHASQHTAGELYIQNREWLRERFGSRNLSCKFNDLQDIVDSDYFRRIQATWKLPTDNQNRIAMCSAMCAKRNNKMQSVYESIR